MRIAVVDDNVEDRKQILLCLEKYSTESKTAYETVIFEDAKAFLADYHYTFDFIILDIDMPGRSGIEAARILRRKYTLCRNFTRSACLSSERMYPTSSWKIPS